MWEEGCSGSSRGLSNIVIPVENASIDHYAKELHDIIEGEKDVNHEYHNLTTQIGYHLLYYDLLKNEYNLDKLKNVSSNVEEAPEHSNSGEFDPTSTANPPGDAETGTGVSSNADKPEYSLSEAQQLAEFCKRSKMAVPPTVKEILNSAGMNEILTNALQHDNWKDNSIPVYEKDKSHFPDYLPDKLDLDPDDPDSFFNFFWQDEDLEKIVKETNKYIDKK